MSERVPTMTTRRGVAGYKGDVVTFDPNAEPEPQTAGPAWQADGYVEPGGAEAHTHPGSDIDSGTVADARIPATIARDAEVTAAVAAAIDALVTGAPGALDTLNELAAAIGDDGDFAGTVTTALGLRMLKSANLSDVANASTALTNLGISAFIKTLLDDADAAAARATLGVGEGGSLTSAFAFLSGDVALSAAGGAYTDVLSLGELAVGTWSITGSILCATTGGALAHALLKLWDGTTVYASGDTVLPAGPGYAADIPIATRIVLAAPATIKVSGAYSNATVSAYAATLIDSNPKASTLVAVKVA